MTYKRPLPKPGPYTTIPIQSMTMYLQPTGIEDSMRRILDINHPQNAIKQWFESKEGPLSGARMGMDDKTRYTNYIYGFKMEDWNNIQDYTNKVIQTLYALLDSPHLYAEGIMGDTIQRNVNSRNPSSDLGNRSKLFGKTHPLALNKVSRGSWRGTGGDFLELELEVTLEEYQKVLGGALKIMQLADWPQAKPQKLFDAPVDDEADLNMLMSMFRNYLNKETVIAPGQMYVPEGFNGMLVSEVVLDADTSNIGWEFHKTVPAVSGPLAYKPSGIIGYYQPAPQGYSVHKMSRYHQGSKTIITKRTVGTTSLFSMPKPITASANQLEMHKDNTTTGPFGQIEKAKGIVGATVVTGVALYSFNRWFVNRW